MYCEDGLSKNCTAGYWCSLNSQTACGGVNVFCPKGSNKPIPVEKSFYSIPEDDSRTLYRTGQKPCPPGQLLHDTISNQMFKNSSPEYSYCVQVMFATMELGPYVRLAVFALAGADMRALLKHTAI